MENTVRITDSYIIAGIIAIFALTTNITIAFIIGMILAYVISGNT